MTNAPPAPNRRRPWSHRTRLGVDLPVATVLFLLQTAWLVVDSVFGLGLEIWAAQGDRARVDAATLTHIDRVWVLLVAAVALAVIAGLFRAPWTVAVQVLVALLAVLMVIAGRHQWDTDHTPSPGCVRYSAGC